jgi:hypothetical protein
VGTPTWPEPADEPSQEVVGRDRGRYGGLAGCCPSHCRRPPCSGRGTTWAAEIREVSTFAAPIADCVSPDKTDNQDMGR